MQPPHADYGLQAEGRRHIRLPAYKYRHLDTQSVRPKNLRVEVFLEARSGAGQVKGDEIEILAGSILHMEFQSHQSVEVL